MDKSLQERLVGAAVLVALGVWLIPWVLDGSAVDDQPAEQAAIKLPVPESPGHPIRRETIDLRADRGAGIKAPQRTPETAISDAAESGSAEPSPVVTEPVAAAPQPAAAEPAQAAADAAEVPEPAADKPASVAAEKAEPSDTVADILSAQDVSGWMVQIGSFTNPGNARRQAQRIGTYGHDARIYEFSMAGGSKLFRVRLGPVETRERAEAAASALAAHGFVAQLVAPE